MNPCTFSVWRQIRQAWRHAATGTTIPRSSTAVAACRFAIVYNLHGVPPVPGHLSKQDNHSLHKWAASICSAGRPAVGGASKRGWIIPARRRRAGMPPGTIRHGGAPPNAAYCQSHSSRPRGSRAQHSIAEPVAELEVTRSDPGIRCGVRARAVDTIPRQIAGDRGPQGNIVSY
jgi:hypothetical protein